MGQKLCCAAKPRPEPSKGKGKEPKPRKIKIKKGLQVTDEIVVAQDIKAVESTPNQGASVEADDAILRHGKIILIPPAPDSAQLPSVAPVKTAEAASATLTTSTFTAQLPSTQAIPTPHRRQSVDQVARELARADARPATWLDLYWALIGFRKFTNDAEKVKALFSWLCSIPLNREVFVTFDDLTQAAKDGVEHAKEALKRKSKNPSADSPEVVVNDLVRGKSTYLRTFESLCRYSEIPCCTIKGLAKGVDYTVGMQLTGYPMPPETGDTSSPIGRIQHAWSAAYVDGQWALFDSMWAAERLAMNASARISQLARVGQMDYETDMFYFNIDPAVFIHSHFPFESDWQLLNPPMTLEQFQEGVLLKPAFFTHGLGLFSHQQGSIPVKSRLIIKLSIPPSLIKMLLFTFNLKLDGREDMFDGVNLSRFGMHEISTTDSSVTFNFRFPKTGVYKLAIYARRVGEPLFTDVCEYRVQANEVENTDGSGEKGETRGSINIPPFPPTSQSSYGATEKSVELKVRTVPDNLESMCKCTTGMFEVRFASTDENVKFPRLTARLKSLLHDSSKLIDCVLVRNVEASASVANIRDSSLSGGSLSTVHGASSIPLCIVSAYLPTAGEYALEVYGAPADAEEDISYFLIWQFLIDADYGISLSSPVRKRLATLNLGPIEAVWSTLGLRAVSHPDPLINVPTKGVAGMQKTRSKNELMTQFVRQSQRMDQERSGDSFLIVEGGDAAAVSAGTDAEDKKTDGGANVGPRSCDLEIVFEKPIDRKLCVLGQLVDISEFEEGERTAYLLQKPNDSEDPDAIARGVEKITYLIRIAKGDHFYKFYLYATPMGKDQAVSLPLAFTYLLEAPQRMMAKEVPYIGVQYGAFPEKLEQAASAEAKKSAS